ncbi:MAG: hypothetical protein QM767_10545 [Anaeromyxobacter sp.]
MSVSRSVWRASMATMNRLASSRSAWIRSGFDLPSMVSAGPWQTSACQSAPGLAASQRSRVFWPPPSRIGTRSRPSATLSRRTVAGEIAPASSFSSATSVRRMSGTDAERCSRRMSSRSWRCSAVSSCAWPRSLRGAGPERREPAGAIRVEPALERRDREPPGRLDAWRAEALLRERAEGGAQLAVVEVSLRVSAPTISLRKIATASP